MRRSLLHLPTEPGDGGGDGDGDGRGRRDAEVFAAEAVDALVELDSGTAALVCAPQAGCQSGASLALQGPRHHSTDIRFAVANLVYSNSGILYKN